MDQIELTGTAGDAVPLPTTAKPLTRSTRSIIAVDRVIYRVAKRWLFVVNAFLFVHIATILLAPLLVASGQRSIARPLYLYHGLFCHQHPNRSFSLMGEKLACCERCAAIYGSILVVGLLFAAARIRFRKPFLYEVALLALPAAVDGGAQALGMWQSTPGSRVLSGLFLGVAICWSALPYLDTGFQRIREQLEALFSRLAAEGRARPLSQ
jgi:uncharacterized membrane protein